MGTIGQLTLDQIFAYGRDLTIAGTVLTLGWKSRGVWEKCQSFLDRIETFMGRMEQGMETLLTNHMEHIEKDIRVLARHIRPEEIDAEIQEDHGSGS